ncbi:MerR family transcriptional regulator [Pseudomonas sp. Marseille-QA0332]
MESQPSTPDLYIDVTAEGLLPIREVARLTGVNPVTLRAWERRHGLIEPTRTASGHRLYTLADVEDIRRILGWLERGVAVSRVGCILARERLAREDAGGTAAPGEHAWWRAQLRQAVHAFDAPALQRLCTQLTARQAREQVFGQLLVPLWQALRGGQQAFGQTSEWLFLDQQLRAWAHQQLSADHEPQGRQVVLAGLLAHCPELELLLAGLLLGGQGLNVTVLPIGQPLEELPLVVERMAPAALVLFCNQPALPRLERRLQRLAGAVACPLLLAGEVAEQIGDGLAGGAVGLLGGDGRTMRRRLRQFLKSYSET